MRRARIEHIKNLIAVGSGKGGVGKSTVSVNLAVALAKTEGARVGLLDGDAYGPSVPMMLGVRKREASEGWRATLPLGRKERLPPEQMLQPLTRYGVKVMSVGFFIGEEQAVAPIPDVLGLLIRQLLYGVNWGELDYLIIDLPPGNGEPQATLMSEMRMGGAILVTTPQDIARIDTAKALGMFQQAGVPVLGLVQNMSGFVCPHCGELVEVFPSSREARAPLDELPVLGRIPLHPETAVSGDRGQPAVVSLPDSPVAAAFREMAGRVARAVEERQPADDENGPESEPQMEPGPRAAQSWPSEGLGERNMLEAFSRWRKERQKRMQEAAPQTEPGEKGADVAEETSKGEQEGNEGEA